MAFLYLGTCQARSEATHVNNADVNLHSWVSPSTLLGSPLDMYMFSGDVPSGTPIHTISPSQPQNLCLSCDHNKVNFVSNWNANGFTVNSLPATVQARRWYVNNMPTDSLGETFLFEGYPVGQYAVKCVVEYVTNGTMVDHINSESNAVIVTVDADAIVNIVGPDHACQNDVVTLTAQLENSNLAASYQWRRDGQYIIGATNESYSFLVDELPGLTDTLVYEFDVQVTRAGCDNKYSPVHYFSVSPTPVTLVDVPLFCNNASSVIVSTSSYTSGGEQPYMWKWTKVGSSDTTITYVNYLTIDNPVFGDKYKVMPIYQDLACNADTALFELKSYEKEFSITTGLANLTLEGTPDLICLGGMTTLTVTDSNAIKFPGIGEATYTWYKNGALIDGVTGTTYTTELSTTGDYIFSVVASYANYPCETPQAADTITVDSVATSVTLTGGNVLCENADGTFNSTVITANVTPTTGTFTYMWTGQTAFTTQDTLKVTTPGVYNVIVKSAAGCETASLPFEVTGFGAGVQVTANITNACAGEPVVLNAHAEGWTGNVSYTWNTGSHSPSIIVNPSVDSVFTVTSTVTMGAGSTCSRTDTFKVVILPAIAVKPVLAAAQDSTCVGSLASVYVTNAATVGAHAYQWYMDDVEIPGHNLDSISIAIETPGIHTFTARPLSVNGCVSDSISASVSVKVKDLPQNVAISGVNVLCQNGDGTFSSTTLTANVVPTNGNYQYKWNTQTAFSTGNTLTVDTPGVYTVTVKTMEGCEIVSNPFTVTGFGADVQITPVITNACAGEPIILNANAEGWTGSVSYAWNTGAHTPSIIVTPTKDSVFTVTSTLTLRPGTTCSRTDSINVIILPSIIVKPILAVAQDSICVGSLASIHVTNHATVGAYTYQWYMDDAEIPGQSLDSISIAMETPGIHTFTARPLSENGCISDSISAAVTVKVKDAAHNISITGDNVLCEFSDGTFSHTTLKANVTPINLRYQYKWNTQTAFSNFDTLAVETPGVYTVTVKTMEGCEVVSAPFNVTGFGANVLISSTETSCPGEPVTLSASSEGWTGSISYAWEGISGNYPTVTVFPTKDTTYKVTTTVIMESGVTCSRVDSIHVYVLPIATVPTVAVVGVDSICEGSLANLAVTNHVNGAYYVWYQNGVVIPGHNLDSISVVLETPGVYEFTAAVVTANGCTTPDSEIPAVVTVKAIPTLVNITGNNVICEDDSTVLTAHVSSEITNPTYKWSTGSTLDSINVPAGVYTVTVTNGQMTGCAATAEYVVTSFGSDVMLTASSQHVCAGADVILNISFDGWVSDNMSHAWVDPDGNAMPGSSQVTASPAKEGWYKVTSTATSTSGTCSRLDSIYVNVDTLHVTDLALTSPYDTICLGAQASFKAVCPGADRFIWYENGIAIPGANLDSITVMPQAAGSYTYSVAGINTITGCVSEDTILIPALLVLDNPSIMISGDAVVCDTTLVELYAHINDTTYAHDNFNYVWRVYNDTLTPDIDSIYNWQAGEWQVVLTDMTVAPANHGVLMTDEFTPQDEPYIIMVQATNERGCVATSDLFYLYIGASPTVAVTIDRDTVCEGGLVTATAHLGNYNMDNLVYQWYEKNKVTGVIDTVAHGTSPTYSTYVDTSVVIGVRVTQTTTQCSIYGEDSVFVLPVKLQKILATNETPLANETDTLNVCKGEGVYLTAYVINEETGVTYIDSSFTYVWYENGFLMPGVTGPTFHKQMDIQDDDTLSYQYTAYIDFGVEGCEPKLVSSNVVFVKRNPIVTIAGHHNVCYYGSYSETHTYNIHLIAWVDGDYDPNMTYTWYEHNQVRYNVGGSIYDNHYRENWVPTYDNPYSFTVEVANSDGCVTISEPFEVNVYNKPEVNITATETTICEGGVTELTAHINNYNDPNLIYQWYTNGTDPDNAIPGMTEPTETYVVDTTTTYLVKVTHLLENGSLTAQACFNVASIVITANEIPVIDSVTTDLAEGNDTICEGRYVTFTAHISKGVQGGELYTWYRNGEVIATTPDSVYRETPQALNGDITVWDYAVKVTQAASGCESEIKGADTITVFPNPVLVLVTDPIVCDTLTDNIVMYANVTPAPTSTYSFTWYEDNQVLADGTMMGSHNDSIKLTRPYRDYAYSFSVELVNEYGCATRDDAIVYVHDNPIVHAITSDSLICVGGEITLTANLDDYNAEMLEFHWYDNDVLIPTATEMTYTVVPALGTHRYRMTALQRNSLCIASSDEVVVVVNPDPIIDAVVLSDYIACEGAQVRVEAIPQNYTATSTDVYTWYRNGIRIPGATNRILFDTPTTVDQNTQQFVYTAVVTLEQPGCTSLPVDANALTIYRNPVVAITGDQHVCETDYTFLIANVDTIGQAIGNLHYTWYVDGMVRPNTAYNLGDSRFFAEYLYPRDEAYVVTVNVERDNVANACASMSAPYEVYVYPKPEVNITANVTDICENGEVTLQANLNDYNADNMTFQWYEIRTATEILAIDYLPGGGYVYDTVSTSYRYNIPGATGFRYTTTLSETTTIGVLVQQTTSECYDIDEFTVTVHATPEAPIITVNNPMICSNGDVDLAIINDYSEYGTPIYAWMMDGVLIPGAFGPTYHQEPGLTSGTTHTYNAIVAFEMPGCISVTSDDADVVVIPDPVVTVTVDGPTTICEGGEVTFSANPQPTTLDYTYQWYDYNNQLMADETNATLTVSPARNQQPYQYKVVVNSLPGCQIVVDAPVVTVVADPVVTLSIDNPIICQGGISTLTVDVQGGVNNVNGIEPYVYNWYNNLSTETPFATTTENFYVLPANQATDSFAYWVEVSANAYGCATTSMHVNQLVVADPVVNIIVAPTYPETVCDGGNTMLVATVQGGYGEPSYQWYRNETILVGETNPTLNTGILSVNDINSYRVIVRQTGSGCETASDTFSVPVIPSYNVVVSALNNATVCEGGTTTLEATITNAILPNDNPTFQWYEKIDGADVAITGATSTRYTTSPLLTDGNHTYFVAVTSQVNGSECSANSSSFYTAIVDDPTVVVSTTSVNNVVCEGDVVRVNATVSPEGNNYPAAGDYTYTWTWTNGTNSYSYTNNEPTFAPSAAELPASLNGYLFNVSIVSADVNSGCNAQSNSNVYVTVMARPTVTISADNAVVCAGGHVELTANHNASDYTGFNYAWTVNGQQIASTAQTITVPAYMVTEGNINANVVVTSSQLTLNCTSTASLTQPVAVVAQPTVSATADFTTMCAGAAPTLTATVGTNASNAPLTYVWQVGGNTINGANGNVYQSAPLAAGTYNFKVMVMTQDQALNCQSDWSDAVVVRVAETPVIGLTSADGLALCEGGNITLTATVLNAGNSVGNFTNGDIYGSYTYVWKNNNNTVATNNSTLPQNQITETLNTVGNYNYVAYVTPVGQYANGCGVAASEPLQVVVNARPNWDAAVVYPVGNICLGEEVQLHAHITGGVTDMNGNTNGHIQWVVEYNGVPSNVANFGGDATHTPVVPGVYTYYPTYVPYQGSILGSGCSFTNSDQVSTFLTVHELPTAAFVSGDGSIICANVSDDNAALTIHFTGTAPFHFIVTDLSNGSTQMYDSYTNDYTIYVSPDHTTQYRISYLSDNYCDNGELGLNAIATVFVNDIQFNDKLFMAECDVNEVTINFNMISGTADAEFTVTYDNGMVVTGTIVNNTATFATPDAPGDYHAVFSVGGCNYDIIVRRPVFSSDFSDGTTPFMMQRWDDVVIINNNPATNGGHTFVSYQWYKNGELIPGAIYKNYQEEGGLNGFYSIEVVSKEADGSIVTYRTCEQYFYASTSVKVYPVPATVQQVVTVELDLTAEELVDATLDIYDAVGAIVNHITNVEPITKVAGFKAAGTYFGRITLANGETKTVKFVIVK